MDPIIATIPEEKCARYVTQIKRIGRELVHRREEIASVLELYSVTFEAELAQDSTLEAHFHHPECFDSPESLERLEQARTAFQAAFYLRHPEFIGVQAQSNDIELTGWGHPMEALEAQFIEEGGCEAEFTALVTAVLRGDFSAKKTYENPLDLSAPTL